jgi:MFS family permease
MVLFAVSNFLGPLFLGRLFDTVGRIPMIASTYLGSAAVVAVLAVLMRSDSLTRWSFMALVMAAFFLASAGASSAYLTVSEIFPMETRALAISLYYAVGTAIGGITGPLIFGRLIHSGQLDHIATGFFIGAAAMAIGGVAELLFGVRAEQRSLEHIAAPLTAEEVDGAPAEPVAEPDAERDERIRTRAARLRDQQHGLRRLGPGHSFYSPGMIGSAGTTSRFDAIDELELDREVEAVVAVVEAHGETDEAELVRLAAARGWGPGRFRAATRTAVREGRLVRGPRHRYRPATRR